MRSPIGGLRASPRLTNVLGAVLAGLLDVAMFSDVDRFVAGGSGDDLGRVAALLGYAAIGPAALLWRRRSPVRVFIVLWLHSVLARGLADVHFYPVVGVLVALFAVALRRDLPTGVAALLAAFVPEAFVVAERVAAAAPENRQRVGVVNAVFYLLLSATVWAAARWARRTAESAQALATRSELAAREAVAAERGRIARELHDIVAHSVTVMVLQAAGARRIADTDPERAKAALAHIEDVGKEAMGELRRLLTVLRASGPDATASFGDGGQPGLDDLAHLLDTVRAAGVPVGLAVEGEPRRLDPSVGLAAYRTVQEALTNVTKHAGPGATAAVRLVWTPRLLTVRITDDGRGCGDQTGRVLSTGHGLLGLRERVCLLGGQLVAGREAGGGYSVTATLPANHDKTDAANGPSGDTGAAPRSDCCHLPDRPSSG